MQTSRNEGDNPSKPKVAKLNRCMRYAEAFEFYATSDLKEQDVKMVGRYLKINRNARRSDRLHPSLYQLTACRG
jgi:hypothetical protein